MNILRYIVEKKRRQYCHVLEVSAVYEIENSIEQIMREYPDCKLKNYIDFFGTIELYCLDEEEDVYAFDIIEFILDYDDEEEG